MHATAIGLRAQGKRLALALAAIAVALLLAAETAPASHSFCGGPGSGAGECAEDLFLEGTTVSDSPGGIARNRSTGDIYVEDRANRRINKFDADGVFLRAWGWDVAPEGAPGDTPADGFEVCTTTCKAGIAGTGAGQFSDTRSQIAVNHASGDVFVGPDSGRIQRFDSEGDLLRSWGWDVVATGPHNDTVLPSNEFEICVPSEGDTCKAGIRGFGTGQLEFGAGLTVGPDGNVYVGRVRLIEATSNGNVFDVWALKFEPSGGLVAELSLEPKRSLEALGVDSDGDIYAKFQALGGIHKYDSSGTHFSHTDAEVQGANGGPPSTQLGIDVDDHLYAVQVDKGFNAIGKYDVSGPVPTTVARFAYKPSSFTWRGGLAALDPPGGVLVSQRVFGSGDQVLHLPEPAPGPLIAPGSVLADPIGNAKATLKAEVNPEGKATSYRFQFIEEGQFEAEGWGGPSTEGTSVSPLPETRFDDQGKPFFLETAQAIVGCPDPLSEAGLPESLCLKPETGYRFRVLAEHENGDDGNSPLEGGTFETLPPLGIEDIFSTAVGTDAAKLHAAIDPLGIPASAHFQYVDEGTCLKDEEELGAGHCFDHALSTGQLALGAGTGAQQRSAQVHSLAPDTTYRYRVIADNPLVEPIAGPERAFKTFAIPPPLPEPDPCPNAAFRTGLSAFLPDCRAYELVSPLDKENGDIVVQISGTNVPASFNQAAAEGAGLAYSTYRAFGDTQAAPFTSQYLARRSERGTPGEGWSSHGISPPREIPILPTINGLDVEYKLFSEDLCFGWLRHDSDPPLAPGAIPGYANLYKRDNCGEGADTYEAITIVSPPEGISPGVYAPELQAVSGDGSHAVFRVKAKLTPQGKADIFNIYDSSGGALRLACILPGGAASGTDCSAGSLGSGFNNHRMHAVTHAVSQDGSRVYWSTGSPTGQLYLRRNGFNNQAENCADPLRRCTIAIGTGQFWAASADGSRALYTTPAPAGGELKVFDAASGTSGAAIAGEVEGLMGASDDAKRVYLVSREDRDGGGPAEAGEPNLYLSEEGALTFVAELSQTDATLDPGPTSATPSRHTARVTPDGAHALFTSNAPLTGYDNTDAINGEPDAEVFLYDAGANELHCVSCNPSRARPVGRELKLETNPTSLWAAAQIPAPENQLYGERVISDDGQRLFFESFEALVAGDTNAKQDVYQWQAPGKGGCTEADPSFNPEAGGCVSLISSGKSPEDSHFIDANRDGSDVYITTGASLLAHDPGLVDIYDARVGGGFPPPPTPPAHCEGEACQSPPAPPEAPTPASSGSYAGNPGAAKPRRRCAKGKRRAVRKSKPRCVKKRRARHNRRAAR